MCENGEGGEPEDCMEENIWISKCAESGQDLHQNIVRVSETSRVPVTEVLVRPLSPESGTNFLGMNQQCRLRYCLDSGISMCRVQLKISLAVEAAINSHTTMSHAAHRFPAEPRNPVETRQSNVVC